MKRSYEILVGIGMTTAVALGASACSGSVSTARALKASCIGLEFTTPKGGPGDIEIDVFPKFNRNFGDARPMMTTGRIVSGNDAGKEITPSKYGSYIGMYTWDASLSKTPESVVAATVKFLGHEYVCPPTQMKINPITDKISPQLPNS